MPNGTTLLDGCWNRKDRTSSCACGFRLGEPAAQHAVPPHDRAGHEHHRRKKTDDDVGNTHAHAAIAPEMHAHEPRDKQVATTLTGKLGGRLEVIHDGNEEVSEPEINPRQTPEEENQQAPEAERCVDVEIHPFPAARRIEVEALVPGTTGPPPDDDTCDAEYTQQGTADGVDFPSGLTRERSEEHTSELQSLRQLVC